MFDCPFTAEVFTEKFAPINKRVYPLLEHR